MKSTYKLLGIVWDRAPLPREKPAFCTNVDIPADVEKPENLFDMIGKRRSIPLTRLFSAESREDLDVILGPAEGCNEIVIVLDYQLENVGTVVEKFLELRALQLYEYIRRSFPDATVTMACPPAREERTA